MSGRDLFDGILRVVHRYRPPAAPPRLQRPSVARFEEFHRASLPVVIEGAVDDWPDRAKWSFTQLRQRFAEREMLVIPTQDGRTRGNAETGIQHATLRFGDYVEQLERGESPQAYLAAAWLPDLAQDAPPLKYMRNAPWQVTRFWLGAAHTSTLLHREMLVDNLFVQLVGRKRFYLYSPAATPWLYSHPLLSALPNYSRFDPEQPDYTRFPLSRILQPLEVILAPGDILYLPSRWWHQVRSLDATISFNFWWAEGAQSTLLRAAELLRRLRRVGEDSYGAPIAPPPRSN